MTLPIEKAQIAKTTEQWTSLNPVLALDVIGIEVMANGYNRYKRGDGVTAWNGLAYLDKVYTNDYAANAGNADTVDNKHASDFLGATDTAANAAKLGGNLPSAFLGANATAVNAAKLGNVAASEYVQKVGSGFIELSAAVPYIDFHYADRTTDYDGRIYSPGANEIALEAGNANKIGLFVLNGYSVFAPYSDGGAQLGAGSYRWRQVSAQNGTIQTSDRREKKEIVYGLEKYEDFFDLLMPVTYKFIKNDEDRLHIGYIAQDVYDAARCCDLTKDDLAMLHKEQKYDENKEPIDGEFTYSLGYGEFAALNTYQIQKLKTENKNLKERLDSLEQQVALLMSERS